MQHWKKRVVESGFDIGIAHDGDADRCLVVDADGNIIDGDHILTILALGMKERGALKKNTVVTTVMSNLGFGKIMKSAGIDVVTTQVGDRYVLEKMIESDFCLGGEQSGHVILRDFANTGDGILTGLALMQEVVRSGKSVEALADSMRKFPQVLINVSGVEKNRLDSSTAISAAIRNAEVELGEEGRVLVRASGTEPMVRVMVEASTDDLASTIAAGLADLVQQELG